MTPDDDITPGFDTKFFPIYICVRSLSIYSIFQTSKNPLK